MHQATTVAAAARRCTWAKVSPSKDVACEAEGSRGAEVRAMHIFVASCDGGAMQPTANRNPFDLQLLISRRAGRAPSKALSGRSPASRQTNPIQACREHLKGPCEEEHRAAAC